MQSREEWEKVRRFCERLDDRVPAELSQPLEAGRRREHQACLGYCRGLNRYLHHFGVPYYNYSIMGPKTLF